VTPDAELWPEVAPGVVQAGGSLERETTGKCGVHDLGQILRRRKVRRVGTATSELDPDHSTGAFDGDVEHPLGVGLEPKVLVTRHESEVICDGEVTGFDLADPKPGDGHRRESFDDRLIDNNADWRGLTAQHPLEIMKLRARTQEHSKHPSVGASLMSLVGGESFREGQRLGGIHARVVNEMPERDLGSSCGSNHGHIVRM